MNKTVLARKIDSLIRFFLYILIFWLPYSPAVIESCVCTAVFLWLVKRWLIWDRDVFVHQPIRRKIQLFFRALYPPPSFLNTPIAFFILACLVSICLSAFFEQSSRGFMTKTFEWFIIYFLIIETMTERKHLDWILGIFVFTAVSSCIDGIVQFHITQKDIFNAHGIEIGNGATAGFRTPNDFGGFLTFVTPLAFFMAFVPRPWSARFLWIAIFLIAAWSTVVTLSRGAWLGIILGILTVLFLKKKKLFLIFIGVMVPFLSFYPLISLYLVDASRLSWGNIFGTAQGRWDIWLDSFQLIQERPLFGHGINTYMMLFQEYRNYRYEPTYAHNCFIQMWAEIGLVGLGCFFWMIVTLFKEIRARVSIPSFHLAEGQKLLAMGLLAGIGAFLTHSFFDTNFYSLQLSTLFWFMVGYLVAVAQVMNR